MTPFYIIQNDDRLATIVGIVLLVFFVTGSIITLIDVIKKGKNES